MFKQFRKAQMTMMVCFCYSLTSLEENGGIKTLKHAASCLGHGKIQKRRNKQRCSVDLATIIYRKTSPAPTQQGWTIN